MEGIFDFEYKDGKVVKRETKVDPDKARLVEGQSVQFLTTLINNILVGNFPGKYAAYSHFTAADLKFIVTTINRAKARKLMAGATTFTVDEKPHRYANEVVKSETQNESTSEERTRYGMLISDKEPLPPVNAELTRLIAGSIRISRGAVGSATRAVPIEPPAKVCAAFVPDLSKIGQATVSMFGRSLTSIKATEKVVNDALNSSDELSKAFASTRDQIVPSRVSVSSIKGRQTKVRNSALRIPEKYKGVSSRAMIKNLMQVPMTDKSGMGYYAQSHYDGLRVTGPERKYTEILQDFTFSTRASVIRVTSADKKVALALFNAMNHLKRDVVVVYEGSETNRLQRFWNGSKVIRKGVVPYPGKLFDHAFEGHLSEVYCYVLDKPTSNVLQTADALYNSNQRVKELQEYYSRYGEYSYYADWSSLISDEEYKTYQSVNDKALAPLSKGFAPTCKVRKGWVMVASFGVMNVDQAMNNIANGRLHYLTWMYRSNHFCAKGDEGHKFVVHYAPKYDWVTGDTHVKLDPLIMTQLESVVDADTMAAFEALVGVSPKKDDDSEEREEDESVPQPQEEDAFYGLATST